MYGVKGMKIEIKRAIGVLILSLILFLMLLFVGNASKDKDKDNVAGGSETENVTENVTEKETENATESMTESESTENSETQVPEETEIDEYESFAIADVTTYVNVRKEPNTESEILGKIYDGAVAQILETVGEGENTWFRIVSGNVEGYIKAEFFIHGEEAAAVMDQYVAKYVKVKADRLNVREGQSTDTRRIGYVCTDEILKVVQDHGEWIEVQYTDEIKGFVSAQYVTIIEDYAHAKTPEDEQKEIDFIADLKDRAGISETVVKEDTHVSVQPPSDNYATNTALRKAIIDYAMQFLGNRYINGGQSLVTGTDCSGFTMYVLREFGYSISRVPQGQYTSAGRPITYAEAQPGDILCYSDNGVSCTHVAFYIGDGKILHAANSRDGVKISSATYTNIYGVRNVID